MVCTISRLYFADGDCTAHAWADQGSTNYTADIFYLDRHFLLVRGVWRISLYRLEAQPNRGAEGKVTESGSERNISRR